MEYYTVLKMNEPCSIHISMDEFQKHNIDQYKADYRRHMNQFTLSSKQVMQPNVVEGYTHV